MIGLHLRLNGVHWIAEGPGDTPCGAPAYKLLHCDRCTMCAFAFLFLLPFLLGDAHLCLETLKHAEVDSKARRISEEHGCVTSSETYVALIPVYLGNLLSV